MRKDWQCYADKTRTPCTSRGDTQSKTPDKPIRVTLQEDEKQGETSVGAGAGLEKAWEVGREFSWISHVGRKCLLMHQSREVATDYQQPCSD